MAPRVLTPREMVSQALQRATTEKTLADVALKQAKLDEKSAEAALRAAEMAYDLARHDFQASPESAAVTAAMDAARDGVGRATEARTVAQKARSRAEKVRDCARAKVVAAKSTEKAVVNAGPKERVKRRIGDVPPSYDELEPAGRRDVV